MTDYGNQEASYVLSEADNREFQKYGIHEIKFVRTAQEVRVEFRGERVYNSTIYFYLGKYPINKDRNRLQRNGSLNQVLVGENQAYLSIDNIAHGSIYIALLDEVNAKNCLWETSFPLIRNPTSEGQRIPGDQGSSDVKLGYGRSFGRTEYPENGHLSCCHSLTPYSGVEDRKSINPHKENREFQRNDFRNSVDRGFQYQHLNTSSQDSITSRDDLLESIDKRLEKIENNQKAKDYLVDKIERYIKDHLHDLENYKKEMKEIRNKDTQLISQINHDKNKLQKEIRDEAQLNIKNADRISGLESQIGQFHTISQLKKINEEIARNKVEYLRERICQDCSDLKLAENNLEKGYVEIYEQVSKVIKKIPFLLPTALPEGVEWGVALKNLDKEFTTIKRRKEGPIDVIRELENINLQDFHDNGSSYSEDIKATFLSQSWTPSDPIQSYQNKLDKYLKKIHTKYLQDREKSCSQLFKTSDEFRDALEKFVEKDLFPFTETSLNEIKKCRQNQEPQKSKEYKDQFDSVRAYILKLAGIEEFSIKKGTSFDEAVHVRVRDQMDTRYPNNVVLETDTPGYRLNWGTEKVIRKARVIINHNP